MTAYGERDVLDLLSSLTEIIDSTTDTEDRVRLLATARRTALEALDRSLWRIVFDLHESGMAQYRIADLVGVDRATVSRWIRLHRTERGLPTTRGPEVEEALANAPDLRAGFKGPLTL